MEAIFSPELGRFALALATALALAGAASSFAGAGWRAPRLMVVGASLAFGQLAALLAAGACLVAAAVSCDFSVANIAANTARNTPLVWRITGTWGNHEGSVLLWVGILAGCGAAVARFGRTLPGTLRARVLGVLALLVAGFGGYALFLSCPFDRLADPPLTGAGMNPLLQDPGLAVHPPVLYAGYVGFAVPFAFAVAALLEGRVDSSWARHVRPWAVAAWSLLTCGIALGSWWAYYELGWGGFWFWDPVENASLLPWLTGTALIHSALVVEKRDALPVWTVLLAIATFALSLAGTFLVRSGILNSVHEFAADPGRGAALLALIAVVVGGALFLFAWRAPRLAGAPTGAFALVSREGALLGNNVALCAIAATVLTGTLYPPLADLLGGEKLSVGKPFFDATVVPMALPVLALMGLAPMLPWKRARLAPALRRLWWAVLVAAAVFGAAALGLRDALAAAGLAGGAWVVLASAVSAIRAASLAGARLPRGVLAAAVAHAGLGVTVLGIAAATASSSRLVLARPGETVHLAGCDWTLLALADAAGPDWRGRTATLRISRGGETLAVVHPGRRLFTLQGVATSAVAIHTTGLADDYAVLAGEQNGAAVLRLRHNPLAPFIWGGALLMAAGGALSLSDRRARVAAPRRRRAAAVPVAAE